MVIEERALGPRRQGFAGFEADEIATSGDDAGTLRTATGDNPFCGDGFKVRRRLAPGGMGGQGIEEAAFDGYTCTPCTATADTLFEHVRSMHPDEARGDLRRPLALLGSPTVGRTRSGCAHLSPTVFAARWKRKA